MFVAVPAILLAPALDTAAWVGMTELEIEFIVTDAATGAPVKGAIVHVKQEEGGFCEREKGEFELATDANGSAKRSVKQCMCYGKSGWNIDTFAVHFPSWSYQVSANGYATSEWAWLHGGAEDVGQVRRGSPAATVAVQKRLMAAADPFLEKIDLFESGQDGYFLYRIPGIVVTKSGTVLAYCEARKNSGLDWDHIDIMLRRSTDGGKTWAPRQKLVDMPGPFERNPAAVKQKLAKPGERTLNNPVAIVDQKTGAVHFLFCLDYGRCFHIQSDDDGKTFSRPVEITPAFDKFKSDYDWKVLATGPGHGIQLKNGRMLVPVWLSTGAAGNAHRPSCISVIYSDDAGKSWQRGDIIAREEDIANPSETVPVELSDGRVLFNIRNEGKPHFRAISISPDGATKWSKLKLDEGLPEPICMASIIRFPGAKNRIIFANPNNAKDRQRKNLSARISYDDAKTWPIVKTIEPGPSGYSDLAVAKDGTILCFFERGADAKDMYRTRWLTIARFNLEWLTAGKDTVRGQP